MSEHCRSCGEAILWARTVNGKPMPLDPEPVRGGNVRLEKGTAHVLGPLEADAEPRLYVSHFATCPQAASHRKRA